MKWKILQYLCMFHGRFCEETGKACEKNNCPYASKEKELNKDGE